MADFDTEFASFRGDKTPAEGVPFDDEFSAFRQTKEREQAALRTSVGAALQTTPAAAARVKYLSTVTGIDPSVIATQEGEVAARAKFQEIQKEAQFSPVLQARLRDPEFTKLAIDDVPTLSKLEQGIGGIMAFTMGADGKGGLPGMVGRGAQKAYYGSSRGASGAFQAVAEFAAPLLDPLENVQSIGGNPLRRLAEGFGLIGAAAGANMDAIKSPYEGNIAAGAESGLTSLGQNAKYTPFLLAGPAGAAAALLGMSLETGGQSYQQAREKGINQNAALMYGASDAVVEFATEKIPMHKLIGDVAANTSVMKTLVKQIGLEVPGEQIATALQDLNEWAVMHPEKTFGDYIAARPDAAVQTLVATIVGTGGNVAVTKALGTVMDAQVQKDYNDLFNAQRDAQDRATKLQDVMAIAAGSKLRELSPETFREHVQAAADGQEGAPKSVHIAGQVLLQTLQAAGVTEEQLAQSMPSVVAQLAEAATANSTVEIPIGELATALPGTPLEQALLPHLRIGGPESLSQSEAEQAQQQAQEYLKSESERVMQESQDQVQWTQESEGIKSTIRDQLTATGRFSDDVNSKYATLVRDFYSVMASRTGMTPKAMYDLMPYKVGVRGQSGAVLDTAKQDAAMYNQEGKLATESDAFKNWFGDSKVVDAEGKPLVVYHGTNAKFDSFDSGKFGARDGGFFGKGFYFTASEDIAQSYADSAAEDAGDPSAVGNVMPTFVSLKNPFIWDSSPEGSTATRDALAAFGIKRESVRGDSNALGSSKERDVFNRAVRAAGHDGVIVQDEDGVQEIVAFNPTQIKSVFNRGTFDPNDANILNQSATPTQSVDENGYPVIRSGDVSLEFAEPTDRLEFIPTDDSQKMYNLPIIAGGKYHGFVDALFVDGKPVALYDIEIEKGSRSNGYATQAVAALLDSSPDGTLHISNVVPEAQGFWEKLGVPVQNLEQGAAYDGQITKDTFAASTAGKNYRAAQSTKQEAEGARREATGEAGTLSQAPNKYQTKYLAGRDLASLNAEERAQYDILATPSANLAQPQAQGPRGTFNPSTLTTVLNENADLSTFLHETGHFFLEAMATLASQPNADPGVVKDMNALLKWFGVSDLATWRGYTLEQQRQHHERFAESFELYLLEGKAPNTELAQLFRTFRAWLTRVYKSLSQFMEGRDLQFSDDIRQVMDRMLATEAQIAEAEKVAGLVPNLDATGEAIEQLQSRSIRDLKWAVNARNKFIKQLQQEAKAKRKEVEAEVTAEVDAMPEFAAKKALDDLRKATKEKPSDADLAAIADAHGFKDYESMLSAIEAVGKKADVIEGMTDQRMLERYGDLVDQDSIELAATEAVHNAARAKSLATELAAQRELLNPRQAVGADAEAQQIIAATKPITPNDARKVVAGKTEKPGGVDPVTWIDNEREYRIGMVPLNLFVDNEDGARYDGTVDAARAEEYANRDAASAPPVIATQGRAGGKLRIMDGGHRISAARARGDTAISAIVRVKAKTNVNGQKITVNALAEAAKQFATNVVGRKPVGELKKAAYNHLQAERRAAKAWEAATAKGDTKAAVQAKQDQMLNNAAVRAANEAIADAKKTMEFFAKVLKGNNETTVEKGRDPDIVNAARAILAVYGVGTFQGKNAFEYMDLLKANDPSLFAVLDDSVRAAVASAKPVGKLTVDELTALKDEIASMWHLAKSSRQYEVDGDRMSIEDAAEELKARMEAKGVPAVMPGDFGAVTEAEKRGRSLQFAGALLRRVEQWSEGMDGKFGGPFLKLVFQPVKVAADRYRADRAAYRKQFTALVENVAPSLKPGLIEAPELGYTFGKGKGGVGQAELLSAMLHLGNESNKRKLLLGRNWATENEDGTLDTSRWDAFMTRMHNTGVVNKAHYDFAQGVWDLLESMKPLAQKTHRDVYGRYFAEVTAESFSTPFGSYAGGYVPALVDPEIVKDNEMRKLAEVENENMAYAFPSTSKGFTKSRTEYNRPLMLDLRTLPQHMDKVLLFSHMEPAVRGVSKVLSQRGVSSMLGKIDPAAIGGMLTPWLNRSARQIVETPIVGDGRISRVLSVIRARAGMSVMFANVSNTVQQLAGITLSRVKIKRGYLMPAMAQYARNPKKMSDAVAAASPFMATRMDDQISALTGAVDEILLNPSVYEKAQNWTAKHTYFLQSALDNVVGPVVWSAAYNQALAEGMKESDAVHFADGTVRQTQGSTLPEDVSRIETGPSYARIFTQFIGYFNMVANTNVTALKNIADDVGLKRGAGKALGVLFFGLLAPAWIAEAIAQAFKGGPDDEDKDGSYLDDWLRAVFGLGTVKTVLAGVPFVGQFAMAGVNTWNNKPYDDRTNLSPAVSMLEGSVGAPHSVYKALVDNGSKQKAVRDVATAISLMTGLPVSAAARPLGYLVGVEDNKILPTSAADAVRGAATGTASPESKR